MPPRSNSFLLALLPSSHPSLLSSPPSAYRLACLCPPQRLYLISTQRVSAVSRVCVSDTAFNKPSWGPREKTRLRDHTQLQPPYRGSYIRALSAAHTFTCKDVDHIICPALWYRSAKQLGLTLLQIALSTQLQYVMLCCLLAKRSRQRGRSPVKLQLVTIKMMYTELFQRPLYCISWFIGSAVSRRVS